MALLGSKEAKSEMSEREPPCEVTGKPCAWQSEEWFDDNGEMTSWDDFCTDCGRWRDWTKKECEPNDKPRS
jgi:hypothetical protein